MDTFETTYTLQLSMAIIGGKFHVFLIKNATVVDITETLSETELEDLRLRFNVKNELNKFGLNL